MSNHTNRLTGWLIKMTFAGILAIAASPSLAHAQSADANRGIWMATSADETVLSGRGFGRLSMADGVLAYQSTTFEWRLPLSEIKRIGASKQVSHALEVESVTGQVYFVAILNGQLTMTSPGKAVQAIQRAVRSAPAPVPARTAILAAGGDDR